mgnify:CR=1 FL=1
MNDRNDILAVIPTYNNEKTVARVIADVRRYCAHVLVVNDGSTDSTGPSPTPRTAAKGTPYAGHCAMPKNTATAT